MQAGKPYKGELKNIKDGGDVYWESVNVSPIRNAKGNITNYVILSEDITSRKRMEVDLVAAKEKAEENDRLKTAFLNNLSHEIRTPLNAVVGYAQLLNLNEPIPEKVKMYSEIIQQGSHQLLSIMDNIITMAVIETGQIKINKSKCNLNKLLNTVYNQLKFKADQKNIKLQSSALFSRYESEVAIDETKVVQVLTNLVENAIKYTDMGFVQFGCSVTGTEIQFFVEDSGRGIPTEMKEVIFERFRQGLNHPTRVQEGLGLGLSISKSYVEFMGGELKLESKENQGSRFTFTIPYKAATVEVVSQVNTTVLKLNKRKTLLVVDDVKINYYLVEEILSDQDITVIYSPNGLNAIELVAGNAQIDLVLMDIKMPGMDGYTATREIKKIRPDLPVIAQTAYALAGDKQKSIENGCDDYISKPITRQTLLTLLRRFLEKSN
jgi:signal transduction histidine kinase/CheY-like chemotaxis protein